MSKLGYKVVERQQMYELNPGDIDGLTPSEIKLRYPEEFAIALKEPYSHRYPRAESYHDLSVRLEPVILELEREPADVLLIGHASVIRCLMAYLQVSLIDILYERFYNADCDRYRFDRDLLRKKFLV